MIELARHIEVLLLENDCVIIPGFGGFVTHHSNARRIEEEELFLPPTRTIGFNPQLKINDGLLIQSYMLAYDTNFSDASKMVERAVRELTDTLHHKGKAEIHGVGEITLGISGIYEFHPNADGLLTPGLYGLSSFEIRTLKAEAEKTEKRITPDTCRSKEVYEIKISRSLIRHTVAAAAAIIVFFFLSVPVENTYIEKENYAMLGSEGLFESIREQSAATSILPVRKQATEQIRQTEAVSAKKNASKTPNGNLKPVSVRTEKVAPRKTTEKATEIKKAETTTAPISPKLEAEKAQAKQKELPTYHIIVASVASKADAQKMVEQLKSNGHSSASIIEGNGKIRVSLTAYPNQPDAYKKINQLKGNSLFKDAWVLTIN